MEKFFLCFCFDFYRKRRFYSRNEEEILDKRITSLQRLAQKAKKQNQETPYQSSRTELKSLGKEVKLILQNLQKKP